MKHMKLALAASAIALAAPALADDVKVGVVVSTTSTYAFVGEPLVNGMKLAADEISAAGAWGGHNVEILYQDNRSDKQEAISLITRMAQSENADIVIGPIATSEAMATGPVANDLKIPMFTTATSPEVLKAGPYIFKSTETADAYMAPVGEHVASLNPASCFLVSIRDNEGYIRQRNVFREIMENAGVTIVGDESVLSSDTDFTALSTKIVDADPDCMFVTTPPEQAANIIIQARQAGLDPDTILAGDSGAGSQKFIDAGGSAIEGTFFPASFVASASDSAQAFAAAYESAYGKAPDIWAATGYTMMQTVANAIRNAGDDVTRDSLRDAMAATKDLPVVMGQGRLSFDADRIPTMGGIVMQISGGSWAQP
ncbi:MAG: ABC transporter substrate-binding protein [Paracoccaceae bacterium]